MGELTLCCINEEMATATLLEQTQELLCHSVPGDQDMDAKLRQLIKAAKSATALLFRQDVQDYQDASHGLPPCATRDECNMGEVSLRK